METFKDYVYSTKIKILGGVIEVRCKFNECLMGIKNFFSTSLTDDSILPDIIIYCNWEKSDRYLYRTSPKDSRKESEALHGVFYQESGSEQVLPWDSYDPPLPPFVKKPFNNTFVGLHAAAIRGKHNNAILFIGPKGSGKTTSTLELVNKHEGFELLTDETVFIRKRSLVIEPFPRLVLPRKIEEGEIKKYSISAKKAYKKVATKPAVITHGFFLEKTIDLPRIKSISKYEALRNIVEHYQFAGTGLKESMLTLNMLAQEVDFSAIVSGDYSDLKYMLESIPKYLENEKVLY